MQQMLSAKCHWGLHIGMLKPTLSIRAFGDPLVRARKAGVWWLVYFLLVWLFQLLWWLYYYMWGNMIPETDRAYIAGLFDGEGSIHFKRGSEKKKKHNGEGYRISNSLRLSMEITMTDESVLTWVHEVLGVGTLNKKPRKGKRKDGTKYLMQYRWRCTFRDAYYVCCLISVSYTHLTLPTTPYV